MGLSIDAAYAQIKALESNEVLRIPRVEETVTVGTIDPAAGTFTWAVPTLVQTLVIPPLPPKRTNTIINTEVGVVTTDAVDLQLRFDVIPQRTTPVVTDRLRSRTARTARRFPEVGGVFFETNGGTTITGFPTVESAADHITVDAGLVCSRTLDTRMMTPPVSRFDLAIEIPGHDRISVPVFILRPPVVGIGVFTVPALPMTIVYAPPQGAQKKNAATYQDTQTVSRSVTASIKQETNTKTVQAYSATDLIGKVAAAIGTAAALVGTGGAAGAIAAGGALAGAAKEKNGGVVDALKGLKSGLDAVKTVLDAVGAPSGSSSQSITTQDDHTLSLTVANMSQYGSASALGPGAGDRIVFLKDVKVVWMAVDGEVGIHVLGASGIGANAVADLMQEKALLQGGASPTLGLDVATIDSLLNADPIVAPSRRRLDWIGAPRIAPPRFEPASPAGRSGSGTGSGGDVFQVSYEVGDGTKHTATSSSTRITDHKPGWGAVLFGLEDNEQTTTTSTFTTSQVTEDKTSDKVVSTVTIFSTGHDDPYDLKLFYDNLFGTYCVLPADSPLLHGPIITDAVLSAESLHLR